MAASKTPSSIGNSAVAKKIVRQDRISVAPGTAKLKVPSLGQVLEIVNYSAYGLLGRVTEATPLKPVDFTTGVFSYRDFDIQEVRIAFVRENNVSGQQHIAFEINGEPLDLEAISGIEAAQNIIATQTQTQGNLSKIRPEFRLLVIEIKDWLSRVAEQTAQQEETYKFATPMFRSRFESSFAQTLSFYFQQVFPEKHGHLLQHLEGLSPEEVTLHASYFREQLAPIIHQAPFSQRAFSKPRGYAGDFEMMNHLYRNSFEGSNLFARALHHYFINEPAGQAVRNRRDYLVKQISSVVEKSKGQPVIRILSVASGPAREIQEMLAKLPPNGPKIEVVLLDQDEESLKGAQYEIRRAHPSANVSFSLQHLSIREVIAKGLPEGDFDLIYSAGLFDYFSDPVAQVAAQKLYAGLRERGRLIIGNFSLHNPTLPLMNIAWDWHLIYRSRADLHRLFDHVGKMTVEAEPLEINLFAVLNK